MKEYGFTDIEKEICVFLSAIEIIENAVNENMLTISPVGGENASVWANGSAEEKLFLIRCVDFVSTVGSIFSNDNGNNIDLLSHISDKSLLAGRELTELKTASEEFLTWLDKKSLFKDVYFSYRCDKIDLSVKNIDIVKICGNASKHNFARLDRMRKTLKQIFIDNSIDVRKISNKDWIFVLQDFVSIFMEDNGFIAKYISCLAYYMNEIRWAIYYTLQPVFEQYCYTDIANGISGYRYKRPHCISGESYALFWDLMNMQRKEPYVKRFGIMDVWLRDDTYCCH